MCIRDSDAYERIYEDPEYSGMRKNRELDMKEKIVLPASIDAVSYTHLWAAFIMLLPSLKWQMAKSRDWAAWYFIRIPDKSLESDRLSSQIAIFILLYPLLGSVSSGLFIKDCLSLFKHKQIFLSR